MVEGNLFLELIQVTVGIRDALSRVPTAAEWDMIFSMVEKHAVRGVTVLTFDRLPQEQRPPMVLMMDWLGQSEVIRTQNRVVDEAVAQTVRYFAEKNIETTLLKGQGLARLYPVPELRNPGDVDVLVREGVDGPSDEFIRRICGLAIANATSYLHATYHHCDFGKMGETEVETHWRPSWFYTPWLNSRFQRWCREHAEDTETCMIGGQDVRVPSVGYNLVYVLVHLYRHLFDEGIGMRQVLDYYFALQSDNQISDNRLVISDEAGAVRDEAMKTIEALGMKRFCAAVMWIMKEVFGLADEALLCVPDEADGKFLLQEVLLGGNFGQHDLRLQRRPGEGLVHYGIRRVLRNFRLFSFGPQEVLWAPLWRVWHYYWWMRKHRDG